MVRRRRPRKDWLRNAGRSSGHCEQARPYPAVGHSNFRSGQGSLYGDRWSLAMAGRSRRQISLSILGTGRSLDGLSAKHGQRRNDAAVLRPPISHRFGRRWCFMPTSSSPTENHWPKATLRPGSPLPRARQKRSGSPRPVTSGASSMADSPPRNPVNTRFDSSANRQTRRSTPHSSCRAIPPKLPANQLARKSMEEIARVSHGKVLAPDKLEQLVQSLASLPEPSPSIRRVQLWSHPATAGLILLLLTIFWIGRKAVGLV